MINKANLNFIKCKFKKQEFKKHFHKNYSIGLILNGLHKLSLDNTGIYASRGEIKILNPYELHIADGSSIWEYINFMPNETIIRQIAEDMCDDSVECEISFNNYIKDYKATNYFMNLFQSLEKNIEYEENLIIFISYLLKNHSSKTLKIKEIPANIKHSIEYINTYCLDDISLDRVSKLSNLSKYHFIKVFKEKIGLTPHQYIITLRIEHAIKLLQEKVPLSYVAQSSGFSDQSHFIRTFKTHYGFTPSELI